MKLSDVPIGCRYTIDRMAADNHRNDMAKFFIAIYAKGTNFYKVSETTSRPETGCHTMCHGSQASQNTIVKLLPKGNTMNSSNFSQSEIARAFLNVTSDGGYTMNQKQIFTESPDCFLVGNDQYTRSFQEDDFHENGLDLLDEYISDHEGILVPNSDFTVGLWHDKDSSQYYLDLVVVKVDFWDAITLGFRNKQIAIGAVKDGTYAGDIKVETYMNAAINMVKNAGKKDKHQPQKIHLDSGRFNEYDGNLFDKEGRIQKINIGPRFEKHYETHLCYINFIGETNDGRPVEEMIHLTETNALKLASGLLRAFGYNPLNVVPEGPLFEDDNKDGE